MRRRQQHLLMLGSLSLAAVARASNVYLQEPGARRARSEQEGGRGGRRRRRRLRLRRGGGQRSGRRRSVHHHPLSPDRWGWSDLEDGWTGDNPRSNQSDLDASDDKDSDLDDDGNKDEEAALQAELAKIRLERAAAKDKEEAEAEEEEQAQMEEAALTGNPLLNSGSASSSTGRLKRRWNDDVRLGTRRVASMIRTRGRRRRSTPLPPLPPPPLRWRPTKWPTTIRPSSPTLA
jgi:hypothetical protein